MKNRYLVLVGILLSSFVSFSAFSNPANAQWARGKTCGILQGVGNMISTEPMALDRCPDVGGIADLSAKKLVVIPDKSECFKYNAAGEPDPAAKVPCDSKFKDTNNYVFNGAPWIEKAINALKAENPPKDTTTYNVSYYINDIAKVDIDGENPDFDWVGQDCSKIKGVNQQKCKAIQACVKSNPSATQTTCINRWDTCMAGSSDMATAVDCVTKVGAKEDADATEEDETCKVDGVGWIVCPLANFLSNVTDGAYTLAEKLLVFRISDDPWSTDPKVNPIYPIWANVRNFANFAFVIAFFAVVFSQATSIGISAYGVRKMLPRIIAAAILVNLSYYICLLGIDISNIVGAGLDGIIKSTTNGLTPPKDGTWETFMSSVLAGGTSLVVLGAAAVWATGPVFAIMVFSFLAILTALAIFLARHALIIMLIIVSPLAFVAYILPGTENLFDKWKKAFIAMLVMYPLVAILFAGSRVASDIMFATSDSNDVATGTKWIYKLFALGVLAIPLFGVPWIVKFSGGVLGRVAGMVNDRNKGLVDRARKAGDKGASTRRDEARSRLMENKLGQKGFGYQKNPDGSIMRDPATGMPVKKSGAWARLGRGRNTAGSVLGSVATFGARRKGDKEYSLEQRKTSLERAKNEDLYRRLGETEEYQEMDASGTMVTRTRPTARAQKLAMQAAGVGGESMAARIRARASAQIKEEHNKEVEQEVTRLKNSVHNRNENSLIAYTQSADGNNQVTYEAAARILASGTHGASGKKYLSEMLRNKKVNIDSASGDISFTNPVTPAEGALGRARMAAKGLVEGAGNDTGFIMAHPDVGYDLNNVKYVEQMLDGSNTAVTDFKWGPAIAGSSGKVLKLAGMHAEKLAGAAEFTPDVARAAMGDKAGFAAADPQIQDVIRRVASPPEEPSGSRDSDYVI